MFTLQEEEAVITLPLGGIGGKDYCAVVKRETLKKSNATSGSGKVNIVNGVESKL